MSKLCSLALRSFYLFVFSSFLVTIFSFSMPALAETAEDRIGKLENQLEQALKAIETLQDKVGEQDKELDQYKEAVQSSVSRIAPAAGGSGNVSQAMEEMEERMVSLEDSVYEMDEKVGSRAVVHAFDALELDIGGFVDMGITHVSGEGDSETNFNRQVFEILINAKLHEDWELFVAQAFLRKSGIDFSTRTDPDFADLGSPVATDTVLAWANYHHSDSLNFQMGRMLTPHGIINIEHFPATLLDPEQPQFLRPFAAQTIFPNFIDAVQIHGKFFMGDLGEDTLSYNVYAGNFASNSSDFNYGGRLAYSIGDLGLTLGANLTWGEREDDITNGTGYWVYGFDVLYDHGPILWKNEIFLTQEDRGDNKLAFYTQPAYRLTDDLIAFYRYDYLDQGRNINTLAEIGQSTEHAGGLVWNPNPNVRLRGIYTHKELEATQFNTLPSADADIFQFSATYNF